MALPKKVAKWFIPLSEDEITLAEANARMQKIALPQDAIPLIIQLVENPDFDLPGVEIFSGATNLETHDYIHLILGRGLLPKDEAFILGFTMGSSNRVGSVEEKLFELFTKYLYPKHYRFTDEDFEVYRDAVRLGFVSDCQALADVDYPALKTLTLAEARKAIGVEEELLRAYYTIEKRRYPNDMASQRLLG